MGRQFSEELLLGLAFAFEQATNIRRHRQPYVRPTADLLPSMIQSLYSQTEVHSRVSEGLEDTGLQDSLLGQHEVVSVSG